MPNFAESLQGKDLGHLKIVAALWGLELQDQELHSAILYLKNSILSKPVINNFVSNLDQEVKKALEELCRNSGRLPWAQFSRTYGEVREMGAARRDREHPYEQSSSPAEALWYRGLLARAFFDTPAGPVEYAYIPDDLLALLSPGLTLHPPLPGRPATAAEHSQIFNANDHILDHTCTSLAALRNGMSFSNISISPLAELLTPGGMQALLFAARLVDEAGQPLSDPARKHLEAARGQALLQLCSSWMHSERINELRQLPGLVFEGKWQNHSLRARQDVFHWLSNIPTGTWWNLASFLSAVKHSTPDFQRPAGDYDSWFIKDETNGEYLRGFNHWDAVDGRLIRYLIAGPMHWLGIIDLACPAGEQELTAFRLSAWSKALLKGETPSGLPLEKEPLAVRSDARLIARRLSPRSVRYQLARFCDWEKETPEEYQYRISPASLTRARQQGLKVNQLVAILNKQASAVPPSLVKALERWDKQGSEARFEKLLVLRVSSEEILQALRKSRASRFLGEPLGPATIAVKPGALDKVLGALAELGYLGEVRGELDEV